MKKFSGVEWVILILIPVIVVGTAIWGVVLLNKGLNYLKTNGAKSVVSKVREGVDKVPVGESAKDFCNQICEKPTYEPTCGGYSYADDKGIYRNCVMFSQSLCVEACLDGHSGQSEIYGERSKDYK